MVESVSRACAHAFSKRTEGRIRLLAGLGSKATRTPGEPCSTGRAWRATRQPNLRQVHLIHAELLDELRGHGFGVAPGELGENVTTRGIELLALPTGAELTLGASAVVRVTGLRNPCVQLDRFQPGLMSAVLDRDADGDLVRKAGVMAVVLADGEVRPGDAIAVDLPPPPHTPLRPV